MLLALRASPVLGKRFYIAQAKSAAKMERRAEYCGEKIACERLRGQYLD
jgi:hypothetical protein